MASKATEGKTTRSGRSANSAANRPANTRSMVPKTADGPESPGVVQADMSRQEKIRRGDRSDHITRNTTVAESPAKAENRARSSRKRGGGGGELDRGRYTFADGAVTIHADVDPDEDVESAASVVDERRKRIAIDIPGGRRITVILTPAGNTFRAKVNLSGWGQV